MSAIHTPDLPMDVLPLDPDEMQRVIGGGLVGVVLGGLLLGGVLFAACLAAALIGGAVYALSH